MSSPTGVDVAIIGAGDVGTAIARELSRYDLRVMLIEARGDVGAGTSKANTAILHTGFDAKPGTLEARLVARGHRLLTEFAGEVGIPLENAGALVVAWDDEQLGRLPAIRANAVRNGYGRVRDVSVEELYRREPHLGPGARGALEVPDESIVCPWTPPLACARQAVAAGTDLRLQAPVTGLVPLPGGGFRVRLPEEEVSARWVVNAAGLRSDEVHRMAGHDGFTVTPRRGELIVFDKLARSLVRHVVLPVPTALSKGVLVAPTVFGNVVLGPTAADADRKDDTATTAAGLARLLERGRRLMPELLAYEVTATYAGLRAATEHDDYQIMVDAARGYACAGGIRSTGLTSALAIAEYLRNELGEAGLRLRPSKDGPRALRMPNIGEAALRPYRDADRIARDPEYGRIICVCERVTRGELRDALAGPLPPADLDGLRRRTRVLTGRCQGFFCGAQVAAFMAERSGRRPEELLEQAA